MAVHLVALVADAAIAAPALKQHHLAMLSTETVFHQVSQSTDWLQTRGSWLAFALGLNLAFLVADGGAAAASALPELVSVYAPAVCAAVVLGLRLETP